MERDVRDACNEHIILVLYAARGRIPGDVCRGGCYIEQMNVLYW